VIEEKNKKNKNKRENTSSKTHQTMFLTYSILLEKSRWNNFNYTLKEHQRRL
jgi:hypothetical protein